MGNLSKVWCETNKLNYDDVVYELSVFNVDKPSLDEKESQMYTIL